MAGTAVAERPGTRTPGTEARTDEGAEEEPRHRLMPLRTRLISRTEGPEIVRHQSDTVEAGRGKTNAVMIKNLDPVLVRGKKLTLADIEKQASMKYPFPNEDGHMNAFLVSGDELTVPVLGPVGEEILTVRAVNFYSLSTYNPEDAEREYELEEERRGHTR